MYVTMGLATVGSLLLTEYKYQINKVNKSHCSSCRYTGNRIN